MIEPAHPAHAAAMAAIHAEAFPKGQTWGPDAIALQLGLPGTFGLIAAEGGMVLARTAADEAEILTLAVAPSARRCGLGRALLDAARREASRRGARAMFLEVSGGNHAAQALYAAADFAEVGRRSRYYTDGTDALILRAALSPPAPRPCGSTDG
jgi:ribosomal-protein-alanine N-acetyltransferase